MSQYMLDVEGSKEKKLKEKYGVGHLCLIVAVSKDAQTRERIDRIPHEEGICKKRRVGNGRQMEKVKKEKKAIDARIADHGYGLFKENAMSR